MKGFLNLIGLTFSINADLFPVWPDPQDGVTERTGQGSETRVDNVPHMW